MSLYRHYSSELEKIAGGKAVFIGGLAGTAVGGRIGSRDMLSEQRKDDERLRRGFISKGEWDRRRKVRMFNMATNMATGATVGGAIPIGAGMLRKWIVQTAKAGGEAAGEGLEAMKKGYEDSLRKQVDYAVEQIQNAAEGVGHKAGKGIASGMHETSIVQGKAPRVHMQHEISPALERVLEKDLPPGVQRVLGMFAKKS
jgi:hypothetical protein